MVTKVVIPDHGLPVREGTITMWYISEGSACTKDQPLFEFETDKLMITVNAPESGVLLKVICERGETAPVGGLVGLIGPKDQDVSSMMIEAIMRYGNQISQRELEGLMEIPKRAPLIRKSPEGSRATVAGASKKENKKGSGKEGLMENQKKDSVDSRILQFQRVAADMYNMRQMGEVFQAKGKRILHSAPVLKAISCALRDYPEMNVQVVDGVPTIRDVVNLAVIVAVEGKYAMPVIKNADQLRTEELSDVSRRLVSKTMNKVLSEKDCEGGTFAACDAGGSSLDDATGHVPKEMAGLVVFGQVKDTPVAIEGQVQIRPVMSITLCYDQDAVYAANAARFLTGLREYIENPYLML